MTDGDAIYAAILAEPGEDLPRLAYADWLEGTAGQMTCPWCIRDPLTGIRIDMSPGSRFGACRRCNGTGIVDNGHDRRAEFIRVQVELARNPKCIATVGYPKDYICDRAAMWNCTRCLSMIRQRELWSEKQKGGYVNGYHWFAEHNIFSATLEPFIDGGSRGPDTPLAIIRRGLVDEIRVTHDSFLGHLPALARHPITRVVLTDREPYLTPSGQYRWFASRRGAIRATLLDRGHDLIPALFISIYASWPPPQRGPGSNPHFDTAEAALDALSAACVRLLTQTRAAAPAITAPG